MSLILAQQGPGGAEAVWAGGFFLVWLLLVGAAVVLFIWALVDAIRNPNLSDNERIVWIL